MSEFLSEALLNEIVNIAVDAGKEILDVYEKGFEVETKGDGSPLTMADQRAHRLIERRLGELEIQIPVLSEESSADVVEKRRDWKKFWLVDPLDGTKEFVKRNGEFTVNIALIENGSPVLGVVHTPVSNVNHFAARGLGAFRSQANGNVSPISVRSVQSAGVTMVASRSHAGPDVQKYQERLEQDMGQVTVASMGSSLKICLIAEGEADIYPRLGPTSEWDTAAAHCVLVEAGGCMVDVMGKPLEYNKENILNPWFLAGGDPEVNWVKYAKTV
ncbi:MAG: 3'(2'),5'-bisphosphate nucleotidase CysQ [Gammaproteobacteria bacterium]|nr:3'(2'),5'-bisphosphate nucleotidase CysQ [Gammaproteobacteria bacterium]NKB63984.1 3'(2'),5'-bisphosphate nucleotidase CysQ [Gammaproteobacteria bacterium]